ncbi:MAG: Maf family protein [Comamonadaceae bacterium]|nr:Maf family protein [Comamonadaceae bacterium]RRD55802.1 septum formation inhibitor Maf [Comamonadaceae bacterium OH2545_COT-014]
MPPAAPQPSAGAEPALIYLASQSPRRRQLLAQIGVPHELLLPEPHEDAEALEAVRPGEAPAAYVRRVTRLKLHAAVARLHARGWPPAPVLCADTTVARGRVIYGKPQDAPDAARMLTALAGATHAVLTAVCLWQPPASGSAVGSGAVHEALSRSRVRFAPLSPQDIADYVASGEPYGKAGAYGIQGRAAAFVARISGSYSGIMGLPLFETMQLLRAAGVGEGR